MKHLFAVASAVAMLSLGNLAQAQDVSFRVTKLAVGMNLIDAEVAETAAAREQGLMYRKSLALNSGMLFDFERPATKVCMWMKNTNIPLSVAFMDNQGVILNIEDMQPQTLDNHCSAQGKAVRYALEMQLGWFAQKHVRVGDQVKKADSAGK
ncbi:MAG TPA: DUF192 domain-containing protein [Burkholderiaceae bacterium]